MVTSPLIAVRNQIATDWEALTPPTDTGIAYHHIDGKQVPDGASSRRCFWFPIPESGDVTREMARTYEALRHTFAARVRLVTHGLSIVAQFDDVVNEAVALIGVINRRTSWTTGADFVQANGYATEVAVDGTVDLVISIVVDAQEAD